MYERLHAPEREHHVRVWRERILVLCASDLSVRSSVQMLSPMNIVLLSDQIQSGDTVKIVIDSAER
jgi:hypothetical protein